MALSAPAARVAALGWATLAVGCGGDDGASPAASASQARCTVTATAGGSTRVLELEEAPAAASLVVTYRGGRIEYRFDAERRLMREAREDERGPVMTWDRTFAHDAQGNLVERTGEASFPARLENEYDEGGRLRRVRWVAGVLAGQAWSYTYDAEGRVTTVDYAVGDAIVRSASVEYGDGTVGWRDGDYAYLAAYDAAGRLAQVTRDGAYQSPADGTPDVLQVWERDAGGAVVRFTQDGVDSFEQTGVDGVPEIEIQYAACAEAGGRHAWIFGEASPPTGSNPAVPALPAID
ncbi:MAG: RHS repeat protein [Polyangiaceae bacterium]|nr:RHS repeat protein [Polyangiaceae bacterium]